MAGGECKEALYSGWAQNFVVDQVIFEEQTDHWDLSIFENNQFGRVMCIDGTIQLTEKDEFVYHEMMAHVPLLSHGDAKKVLIIGGGDGGLLREVLRHDYLESATLVEIDAQVIEVSKKYMPMVSQGAFDNPKAKIIIQDATQFVRDTTEQFDVILCDSTDPEGPGAGLFTSEFYADCKKRLTPGGIFANQNGAPFVQKEEIRLTFNNRTPHFKHVSFYVAPVPTYVGGFMAFGWASDQKHGVSETLLKERLKRVKGKMRYYTPAIHKASFALPQYVLDAQ